MRGVYYPSPASAPSCGAPVLDRRPRVAAAVPPAPSLFSWKTVALVAAVGAAIYFATRPRVKIAVTETLVAPAPSEIETIARARGFSSVAAYEDSIKMLARELRAAGAEVRMAPHLAHLEIKKEGALA